jgi:hypothetical protein
MADRRGCEVEVLRLRNTGKARKQWFRIWDDLGWRICCMPEWMQEIVLEDVNTAVRNRIAVMEMIGKTRVKKHA